MAGQDRHDMTDAQWALIEPLLPDQGPRRGGRWAEHRAVVDGIRWRTRTGAPWRDVPADYGCWQTIYGRHRRWCADGTWTSVLGSLRAGADRDRGALDGGGGWVVGVDSTVVRAHADAAGARHAPPRDVDSGLLEELASVMPPGATPAARTAPPRPADRDGGGASGGRGLAGR